MEKKDLNTYGKIHSIESFGTVDGPGVRFVLFLQGCHLKCKYCHNRDSWDINEGTYYSVDEIFKRIIKYKNYIHPNGGITISGGEPLLQSKFLITLFQKLKTEGLHTCIDTSGIVNLTDDIKTLLSLTDLVLLDIKHINSSKCEDLVGKPNELELEFARYLSDNNIPVWIRQVLIPGYTDNEKDLTDLKNFISTLSNVEKVELLPYHSVGEFKWKQLESTYELSHVEAPTPELIKRSKEVLGI